MATVSHHVHTGGCRRWPRGNGGLCGPSGRGGGMGRGWSGHLVGPVAAVVLLSKTVSM